MKRFFILLLVISSAVLVHAQNLPDSIIVNGRQVDTLQPFRTGYFTTFGRLYFGSFFESPEGYLHISMVDNYELFYCRSTDKGETWSIEKIITGHEGDIFCAQIAVDNEGKVFIGFTVHDDFNYANPTGVTFGIENQYKLYCANNVSGSWVIDFIDTYEANNAGPRAALLFTDAYNNVHLIANRYGWMSYGGVIWEYIHYSATNSWGAKRTVCEFTDANIDQFIYDNYTGATSLTNKYALVLTRTKFSDLQLFYILGEDSTWQAPVVLENNISGLSAFSIAYTPSDHIYIGYLVNTTPGKPVFKGSKDFATPEVIPLPVEPDDTLQTIRLFCNSDSLLTMVLWRKNKNQSLLFSYDGINWTDPVIIDTNQVYYLPGYVQRTNTVLGSFGDYIKMVGIKAGQRASQPYGPDTLYYGGAYIFPMASAPELISPADSTEIDTTTAEFIWGQAVPQVTKYWFEIADNPAFSSSFIDSTLEDTLFTYSNMQLEKNYYWRVRALNRRGWGPFSETNMIKTIFVSIKEGSNLPSEYSLEQNYPNPFNPVTTIEYGIKERSFVRLSIIDILGQEIKLLINEEQERGYYNKQYNASALPSGIYFYRLKAGGSELVRKMVLIK